MATKTAPARTENNVQIKPRTAVEGAMAFPSELADIKQRVVTFPDKMPTLDKQPISAELRVKVLNPETGKYERIQDLDGYEFDTTKPENYRAGFVVDFLETGHSTYLSANEAKAQGLLAETEEGLAWATSEAGFQAAEEEGGRGKFTL